MQNPPRSDSTQRFTDRVADYVRYRPVYPVAIIEALKDEMGLSATAVVADIGSGTGISSELFLRHGCTVFAVEPNEAMRMAAERRFERHERFHSIAGSAERTTLPAGSVDVIAAGQAFHWFDAHAARFEFLRILRPAGWATLFWNERKTDGSPFMVAYEALLQAYGTDYERVHLNVGTEVLRLLFGQEYRVKTFPNEQVFDLEGLRGRLLSSSYAPREGQPQHEAMLSTLQDLFDAHQDGGRVRFLYDTRVYFGFIAA